MKNAATASLKQDRPSVQIRIAIAKLAERSRLRIASKDRQISPLSGPEAQSVAAVHAGKSAIGDYGASIGDRE
jgi:hypothetical protein